MGLSNATLNGHRAIDARVSLPAWGAWYADVVVDGDVTLTGAADLKVADLSLKGTILPGGADKGRSLYRIVGGKGGWGKSIPRKSYNTDVGVKQLTVLNDAAQAAGETLDTSTVDSSLRLGPAWVRKAGPACRVLELLSPGAWYIDEAGVTKLGKRATSTLDTKLTKTSHVDKARATLTLASETIAKILPGVVIEGLEAVDVEHKISKDGLRTKIWGRKQFGSSREVSAIRTILEQLDPGRAYRGIWEYRVVTQSGERLNLQPVRVSSGMPDLGRVTVRPGVPGAKAMVTLGSRVLVGFIDEDPARPVVLGFEDAEGSGFKAITLEIDATALVKLGAGVLPVARGTDLAAGIFPIIPTQVKVLA